MTGIRTATFYGILFQLAVIYRHMGHMFKMSRTKFWIIVNTYNLRDVTDTPNHLCHLSTANKQKHPQVHILMAELLFSEEYKSSALYKVQ